MNIAKPLLTWFAKFGRHDLPWQTGNPYHVWLSEIMLQQTQVSTVIPYFLRFIKHFPNCERLAHAPLDDVLALWAGLGYYARARNLHKTAQKIQTDYQGQFPKDLAALQSLPGIGRSTAGAIIAQAFNLRAAILDGNVKRILARLHEVEGWYGQKNTENQLWQLSQHYTPTQAIAQYTQAIMDLGATVCTRSKPRCDLCPLTKCCAAYNNNTITQYPHKKPKKRIPNKYAQWLVLSTESGQILLEHCQEKLWGGLWIFPQCAPEIDVIHHLQQHYSATHTALQTLPALSHTFSHFHLHIQPQLILVNKPNMYKDRHLASRWIELSQIESLAIPAPVKRVLQELA